MEFQILKYKIIIVFSLAIATVSCEKNWNVKLPESGKTLVVEGYVNQWCAYNNYVILTESQPYLAPGLAPVPVSGAQVLVTEGAINGSDTLWQQQWTLTEQALGPISTPIPGFYANPDLKGQVGKVYRLQVKAANGYWAWGATYLPLLAQIDSVKTSLIYSEDSSKVEGRLTYWHQDRPDVRENYRMLLRMGGDSTVGVWGTSDENDFIFSDENFNGLYRERYLPNDFFKGDTIHFYFITMDRPAYNFWRTYSQAQDNGGPYATPIQINSNVKGAIGSFTAMGVQYFRRTVPVK